jgi:glycosyltransferase involved in cell wall biosynthesis
MTARRLLVDCVVRSDAPTKVGGDTVQLREYERHLADRVDFREVPFHPSMRFRPGAVVHIFNVDRPFEFLTACRLARHHPRVVSPIHHNLARVRAMRKGERGRGLTSLVGRVLPESGREWLGMTVRAVRRSRRTGDLVRTAWAAVSSVPALAGVWRRLGRRLDEAVAVALLAEGEGADLRSLTGWRGGNAILVPNGRPEDLDLALRRPWSEREPSSILVVGRIEPRKRQLELARAADATGTRLTFLGQRIGDGDAYTRAFDELAARSPFVDYAGAFDRREVLRRMGAARVLLNASWVEVQSLVDLEAASMGCAVVATPAGHSKEWLGDSVTVVDDPDVGALVLVARGIAEAADGPRAVADYTWTWADASERLHAAYVEGTG